MSTDCLYCGLVSRPKFDLVTLSRLLMVKTLQEQTLTSILLLMVAFSLVFPPVVQSLSHVWLFVIPWTAACQASLSFRITWSLSNSCPLSQWCHPTISSSVIPFSSCLSVFPRISVFSNELALPIRWPKYWSFSFSISPSSEYSGLISFRMHLLILLSKGLSRVFSNTTVQMSTINSSVFSLFNCPALTLIHNYWKNHSFDYTDLCWQSDVSAF